MNENKLKMQGPDQLKTEILSHPHIPKPLHGLNPRSIKGKEWWDKVRFEAQKRTNYHCAACGIHKTQAKNHQWLEGHEYWDINYHTGICKVVSIEPLCHYCHNFIHSGRLKAIMGKEKSVNEVKEILEHGLKLLSEKKLKCFPFTLRLAESLNCQTYGVEAYELDVNAKWEDYVMILDGETYYGKFKSFKEWKEFYER